MNVYANVYTYDIWGHKEKTVRQMRKAYQGRTSLHICLWTCDYRFVNAHPVCRRCRKGGSNSSYYGDVSFIHSVDMGLFSKRLTGNQLISAMILTWLVGIMARVIIPASVISPSLIESVAGCVLPVLILAIMEVWSARKSMKTKVIKPFVNILILKPIANQR